MLGRGLDEQTGGFVEHHEALVDVHPLDRGCRRDRSGDSGWLGGARQSKPRAGRNARVFAPHTLAVEGDTPLPDERGGALARSRVEQAHENFVEAFAAEPGGHLAFTLAHGRVFWRQVSGRPANRVDYWDDPDPPAT